MDENVDFAISLTLLIRYHGCEAEMHTDIASAYSSCATQMPLMVIMHAHLMYDKSTYLCVALRELPGGKESLLVGISDLTEDELNNTLVDPHYDVVFGKPIDNVKLQELISSVCNHKV